MNPTIQLRVNSKSGYTLKSLGMATGLEGKPRFKPVKLLWKTELMSHPACTMRLVNIYIYIYIYMCVCVCVCVCVCFDFQTNTLGKGMNPLILKAFFFFFFGDYEYIHPHIFITIQKWNFVNSYPGFEVIAYKKQFYGHIWKKET